MAVAAETLNRAISDEINYVRPPKEETYGRSLNTIYRLGSLMVGKVINEVIQSPEADQARAEFYTSVEEGFGTDQELGVGLEVRDFDTRLVIQERVMSKDLKTPVSDMTHAGLICAQEANARDKRFSPQLTRSKWDHENALHVDKMARGETEYNTRIIVSPFPEEAAAQSGNTYWRDIGYVPHLKRGFIQLYHMTEDGLVAGSLSFDGGNKEKLREILHRQGVNIPENEVTDNYLAYAITDTLTEAEAKTLALGIANEAGDSHYKKTTNTVDVARQHRSIIEAVFNGSYIHACESHARGYQTPATRKLILELANQAGSFNRRYAEALYKMRANEWQFTDTDMTVIHELLVYSTIEMMRDLHIKSASSEQNDPQLNFDAVADAAHLQAMNAEAFQKALSDFGANGARQNRTYSACGLSISLGGENQGADGPQTVFGGSSFNEDRYGKLTFVCPNGHHNRRPHGKLLSACQHKGCKAKVTC